MNSVPLFVTDLCNVLHSKVPSSAHEVIYPENLRKFRIGAATAEDVDQVNFSGDYSCRVHSSL